ncbi:MAG TPA: TIGR04283 family arsenosugar biosynthesis glycosyltransferase [Gemmataceae bacterium]|nr:TIGR04283 family arsenosugar biosynthesis glycosyltransferase [Gemmataceae bacterium]
MSISVIIPALNEAETIGACLRSLRVQRPEQIIVVDGGSNDGTVAAAADADEVILAARGRALQMNAGAARAHGDVLLFLHADCVACDSALADAQRLLRNPSIAAGCFTMGVQADGMLYRSIDACASARVRLTGLIYGDQGLFVRRRDFERIGGFPPLRLMEDVFISRTLRRLGRIIVARSRILVSPRRWQRTGLVRQTLRNWMLTSLAAAGVHPDRLAAYYPLVH